MWGTPLVEQRRCNWFLLCTGRFLHLVLRGQSFVVMGEGNMEACGVFFVCGRGGQVAIGRPWWDWVQAVCRWLVWK